MPIQVCYICVHNDPKQPDSHAPAYADCSRCRRATCSKHGRNGERESFYCVRCLHDLGRR